MVMYLISSSIAIERAQMLYIKNACFPEVSDIKPFYKIEKKKIIIKSLKVLKLDL